MASISSLILEQLDELIQDDFERFKWSLTKNMAQGFRSIPQSKLEKAKQHDVVELMVNQYGPTHAANITVQVLKQIGQNQLSTDLEEKLKGKVSGGQAQAAEVDGASSSSSSSPAAGVSQSISAQGTNNVQVPVLSGGNYYGPLTMNFTTPLK